MSEITETWAGVPGWEEHYEVSSLGRVRSIKRFARTNFGLRAYGGKLIAPVRKTNGYMAVNLTKIGERKQLSVHVIVASAFLGPRPTGMHTCHWNGQRDDNRLANLRWDTVSNNHQDKKRHGTWQEGATHWRRRLAA